MTHPTLLESQAKEKIHRLTGEGLTGQALRRARATRRETNNQPEGRIRLMEWKYMLIPLAVGLAGALVLFIR
jgi:hypothetical protein